jgi:predicted Fe-Mo cluster-binding NifX family protein
MKLCIPTDDDRGLDGRLSSHFGSAPFFTLVDSETGTARVVANLHENHEPGTCQSAEALRGYGVGAVVCRGLGRRAYGRLRNMGLPVFVTEAEDLAEALEEYRAGRLDRLTSERACHGGRHHGHHHGHSA